MIRFRLKELIAEQEFQAGRRVTLDEIAKATDIHRSTLSKIANIRGYNTTTENLDRLCEFFGCRLEDMAVYVTKAGGGRKRRPCESRAPFVWPVTCVIQLFIKLKNLTKYRS